MWFFLWTLATSGASISIGAQEPAAQGRNSFQVQVTAVPVDVIVTDREGRLVLDLSRDDFEIYEDDVRQKIETFELSTASDNPDSGSDVTRQSRAAAQRSLSQSSASMRTFLLVLGRGRQTAFHSLDKIIQFVETGLQKEDRVAVLAYNRATTFTSDHGAVAEVLRAFAQRQEEIEAIFTLEAKYIPTIASSRIRASVQEKIDAIFATGRVASREVLPVGSGAGMDLSIANVEGTQREQKAARDGIIQQLAARANRGRLSGTAGASDAIASSPYFAAGGQLPREYPMDLFPDYVRSVVRSGWDVSNLSSAVEYLRFLPGEKHLLFFSPKGLFLPSRDGEDALAEFACQSRVRIHCIHTGGAGPAPSLDLDLDTFNPQLEKDERSRRFVQRSAEHTMALRSMIPLARDTGGFAFLMDDALTALSKIGAYSRSVYLLSYRPNRPGDGGAFHRIKVNVKRKGVSVHYRRGYYSPRPEEVPNLERFRGYARIVSVAAVPQKVQDFALDISLVDKKLQRKQSFITTRISMYFGEEMVEEQGGAFRGRMPYTSFFLDRHGKSVYRTWDAIELNLSESTLHRLRREGLSFERRFVVPADLKDGWVKVVVYDPMNDRVASVVQKVSEATK